MKLPAGYDFDWVDAFTIQPFGGNGCVVVHGADAVSVEDRLALVRETSLSECAFLVGSDVADFGARYYLTEEEIPMAGHPTIATVASLIHRDMIDLSGGTANFTLEVGAGVLPISVFQTESGVSIQMAQLRPTFGMAHSPDDIAKIYGLDPSDIVGEPQTVSTGSPFCIVLLRNKTALKKATLNPTHLSAYQDKTEEPFLPPFLVTMGGETPSGDVFSRLFLPPPMPAEDPFTGSATGCMAAYLWAKGHLDQPIFVAEQGHWMGRPGQAQVEVLGPRDDISTVHVAGQARILMSGTLYI